MTSPQLAAYHSCYHVGVWHLRFPDKRWETFDVAGNAVTRAVSWGMPRLDPTILNATFFLYPSEAAADSGSKFGGTGFIVGYPIEIENRPEKLTAFYAVSNWHVVCSDGASVIRLKRKDGTFRIYSTDPSEWTCDAANCDIAVMPLPIDQDNDLYATISTSMFLKENTDEIGLGDDLFMVGRFVDFDGIEHSEPAVRFGNISMMPQPIKDHDMVRESFCVDMHSRTGYSGSPVFVYRTPGSDFTTNTIELGSRFFGLLGIHWSQFPEEWEIKSKSKKRRQQEALLDVKGEFVEGLSGMTCVQPAWKILELLDDPSLQHQRRELSLKMAKELMDKPLPPKREGAENPRSERKRDAILSQMLDTPPKPNKSGETPPE